MAMQPTSQRADARTQLLDAAEQLFAIEGIDAVSNRRIVERAGAANHSAVAYHFGNRDGLIEALLLRHREQMEPRRAQLEAELPAEPRVHDLIRYRLLPMIEVLDALPRPAFRAQFLAQVVFSPSSARTFERMAASQEVADLYERATDIPADVSAAVVRARSSLVGHMVLGILATYERRVSEGTARGTWLDAGYFLIDAAAGMLCAPSTHAGPVPDGGSASLL